MSNYRIALLDERRPGEKRVWWSEIENRWLLDYIKDMQVVKSLVRKRQKNADIFKTIEIKMKHRGSNKTWQQIRSRWKRMKSEYIREKRMRNRRKLRRASLPRESSFYKAMTEVLGKYSDQIECTSAYLGEEKDDDKEVFLSCIPMSSAQVLENGTNDGEVKVQVELIEGDGVLDQNMTVIEPDIQEVKQEPPSPPATPPPPTVQETKSKDSSEQNRSAESSKKRPTSNANSNVKAFADEYARKYSKYVGEYQEQYQEWFEKQVESQQQWEETFMQEQMELAKSMLENVATTFLQSMQQVLQNVVSSMRHRTLTPFMPSFTQRSMDINGLSGNEFPVFISAEGASSSGPTVLSTRSLADESFNNM